MFTGTHVHGKNALFTVALVMREGHTTSTDHDLRHLLDDANTWSLAILFPRLQYDVRRYHHSIQHKPTHESIGGNNLVRELAEQKASKKRLLVLRRSIPIQKIAGVLLVDRGGPRGLPILSISDSFWKYGKMTEFESASARLQIVMVCFVSLALLHNSRD